MSIPEALKGAQAELARIPSPIDKLRRIASYVRIIGAELLGSVTMIPYGARALTLHRSLPEATLTGGRTGSVSLARSKHYAAGPRNTLDIYLPADTDLGPSADPKTPKPIVLFCHGGIWATGEAWHYAPMAVRLAQAGIITAVMQYTLYPQAIAPRMAEEVSQALTWTMEHAGSLGGDAQRVTLVGHSAGAQLCAMALLHRAAAACGQALGSVRSDGGGAPDAYSDARMPCQFVGMAGVFDIAKHFQYEEARGVHELSTMGRAVGGPEQFAANSPSAILNAALERDGPPPESKAPRPTCWQIPLQGDVLAQRIGLQRTPSQRHSGGLVIAKQAANVPKFTVAAARKLPPCVLQSSCSDVTVPWYESAEMYWALQDCGVPAKCLVYNRVGHGDFVVGWSPRPSAGEVHGVADLAPYAADLVAVLEGGGLQ